MTRGPDAATMLGRAIERLASEAGCGAAIRHSDWQRWASATFSGARHQFSLVAPPSPALDAWLATLPEAEIALPGHLLADLSVFGIERGSEEILIELEALTVEDR